MAATPFASTAIIFSSRLPTGAKLRKIVEPQNAILIYDHKLTQVSSEFKSWQRQFPNSYAVKSGESLKDLASFPQHLAKLSRLVEGISPKTLTVVAVGGGSVGDFAGFFASVFKRGVALIHIPSTWLAAIDSSHGGKTALNLNRVKNQIGTFYPAQKTLLIKSLLSTQSRKRIQDGCGELAKAALIDGGAWVKKLNRRQEYSTPTSDSLWEILKPAIQAKLIIVRQDPFEKSGLREVLNLGHTIGHVLEVAYDLSHGAAVAQGLFFAIDFSVAKGFLSPKNAAEIYEFLEISFALGKEIPHRPMTVSRFKSLLSQDKKRAASNRISFIFVSRLGKVIRRPVSIEEIVREATRQGWVAKTPIRKTIRS